ncbi:GNAT family N-acetyltransferase [Rhizobium leguminosarum]|uniref:GNAT family N-acetyltransferase n=1 Tax=Rhizobium leguminosarum TaxID=384 RepID=UPI001C98E39D|nr:GNAT family N-acetyltransferase [Rhizobium leguminosarum]MBY5774188.1 GNAT family N-acetyltransferase [Rhizobium leguminosarum]
MIQGIPTLATGGLTLRPMKIEDFAAYENFLASERSKGMGGPFDRSAAWGLFCGDVAMWHLFGHGSLMVELTDTKECVGQVSINGGPNFPETELGWFLYDGYEGHGYATKAASVMRDWAFAHLKLPTLVSYASPKNPALGSKDHQKRLIPRN